MWIRWWTEVAISICAPYGFSPFPQVKVVIADSISQSGTQLLREAEDIEVVEAQGHNTDWLKALLRDADALIVRSETQVTEELLAGTTRLKVIGRAGVGVDNIDVEAATRRGIIVMNAPGGNTIATAELTMTHLLCSARPICQANASVKNGKWERAAYSGTELYGKTLGILGLGRVGTEVAHRAQAFGMRILAYDPYLSSERAQALHVKPVELDELYAEADFITVHIPLTEDTRYLVDGAAFARMKKGVRLLNCARGGIIDEAALEQALAEGSVAAAGLDVYETEPLPEKIPLRDFDRVVMTPHLGASTREARESVGREVAEGVGDVLRGGIVRNAVNMPAVDSRTLKILRPYLSLGQRLATILQQLSPSRIQTLRVTYWGKIVELDALTLTRAIQRSYLARICGPENVNDVSAPHHMKRLGIGVEATKSNSDSDYTDLVRLETVSPEGETFSIEGTLVGTLGRSRIVHINGRDVEATPEGCLLILENRDAPGIIGMIGTVLGTHQINIANMSLSRNAVGGIALTVLELDSLPGDPVIDEITKHTAISNVHLVEV